MIVCNGAGITAYTADFGEIQAGGFTQESFCEHVKLAVSELEQQGAGYVPEKPLINPEVPEFTPKRNYSEEEQILTSCLINIASPVVIDEQPKMAEIEIAVKPQAHAPELPEAPEFPQPEKSELAENPKLSEKAQIPQTSQVPEAPAKAEPPEPAKPEAQEPVKSQTPEPVKSEPPEYVKPEIPQTAATSEAAQPELIESYFTTVKAEMNIQAAAAELPEANFTAAPIISEEPAEKPAEPVNTEKQAATQMTQEAKELLEKAGEVKFAVESGKSAELTAEAEKPEETLKAWETLQKAHVVIQQKPEELSELLGKFKAQNPEQTEKPEKAEIPKSAETTEKAKAAEPPKASEAPKNPETMQAAQTAGFEQKLIIPEKAELPQSTVTQVAEQVLARITTAGGGTTTFEMVLNPAELGKIAVRIVIQATGTAVEITAEKATTAQLLQNSADRISLALERSDAKLESFIVNTEASESKPDYSEQRENRDGSRGEQEQDDSHDDGEEEQGISFAELLRAS
ncbi:MAG: flagellar hook-length control protein FliK [Oscillospiraceae bacterium]|nr:flagellar hook-length control protein FliK [Oscillospiraceae bacterium]